MAQHVRTLPFLVVLPLLFAAASFGQSSDPASEEMGIPIGHKVIAMKFPSGSTLGHLHQGDLVQVISGAADSEPIARNIRVFAEPNPLKNKVGGSCIVHLLVSGKIADQILRAHKIGQIRLVLPGGTQISPTKNLKTDPNEGRGEAISTLFWSCEPVSLSNDDAPTKTARDNHKSRRPSDRCTTASKP